MVGVDWRVPLDEARRRVGPGIAVQGNLDPALCLGTWEVAAAETREVLDRAGTAPGHIFNLGHGVLPETDPGILEQVVELVHAGGTGRGRQTAECVERDPAPSAYWSWPTGRRTRPRGSRPSTPASAGAARPRPNSSPS